MYIAGLVPRLHTEASKKTNCSINVKRHLKPIVPVAKIFKLLGVVTMGVGSGGGAWLVDIGLKGLFSGVFLLFFGLFPLPPLGIFLPTPLAATKLLPPGIGTTDHRPLQSKLITIKFVMHNFKELKGFYDTVSHKLYAF